MGSISDNSIDRSWVYILYHFNNRNNTAMSITSKCNSTLAIYAQSNNIATHQNRSDSSVVPPRPSTRATPTNTRLIVLALLPRVLHPHDLPPGKLRKTTIIGIIHKVMERVRPRDRQRVQSLIPAAAGIPEARASLGLGSLGGGIQDVVAVAAAAGGWVVFFGVLAGLEGVEQVQPVADFVDGGDAQVVGGFAAGEGLEVAHYAVEFELVGAFVGGECSIFSLVYVEEMIMVDGDLRDTEQVFFQVNEVQVGGLEVAAAERALHVELLVAFGVNVQPACVVGV